MSEPAASDYRCNHCGRTVKRHSEKRWIKSYCDESGRTTRLWKVTGPEPKFSA